MTDFDPGLARALGGWDARYAVVLATASRDSVAAAIIDTNGDGAGVALDLYTRAATGEWVGQSSSNSGVDGLSWNDEVATGSGWADPGSRVTVEYMDVTYPVEVGPAGCWLFVAPTGHPHEVPRRIA